MFIGHVYPLGAFDEIYIGQQGDDPGPEDGMVIWENNFNSTPEWSSAQDYTGAVRDTHALAISQWNATSFRVSGQNVIPSGQHVLSVQSGVGRNGGKALVYAFYGRGDWMAASIDIDFADPDVIWRNVDRNGYDKIWLRYWYRTPVNLDFDTKAPGNTQTTVLWKVARAYAFNPELYYTGASDPDIYWGRFWAKNDSVSSHYLNLDAGQQYYKKPFMIPSINHVSGYWLPQWIRETDPDGGTSAYFNINDRRNLSTHWVSSLSDPANLNGGNNITGFLADGEWHLVEICLKLNDVGQENSIQEFYLDGSEFPVTTIGNDLGMRITPGMKFRQIVLFDNYLKNDKSTQYLYIDSIVISTERLPYNYEAQ
jgi:hypothetical protein